MNRIRISIFSLLVLWAGVSSALAQKANYRCLVQMNAYEGQKAYVVVSLVNHKGEYEQTLRVMGPDKRWYDSLSQWHKAQKARPEKLDAVTGASIVGGGRSVFAFSVDEGKLDKGYTLRFESSVEDQKYYVKDVEIPLSSGKLTERTAGTGYIKLVKISPAK